MALCKNAGGALRVWASRSKETICNWAPRYFCFHMHLKEKVTRHAWLVTCVSRWVKYRGQLRTVIWRLGYSGAIKTRREVWSICYQFILTRSCLHSFHAFLFMETTVFLWMLKLEEISGLWTGLLGYCNHFNTCPLN